MTSDESTSVSTPLAARIRAAIAAAGGWLPFDRFMAMALYEPGLGYYSRDSRQFGTLPASGSDFVTAPELSPLFGRALAVPLAQALQATGTAEVWEFGAGSGALAEQLLDALPAGVAYRIVDLSLVKRGAIFEVCSALAGKEFTREEFEAACPGDVRARAHFYWAKAHGVLAA